MKSWGSQFRPSAPQNLHDIRDTARDLADQAGHSHGHARTMLYKVDSVMIFTTAELSGAWAAIHLWRELFPRQKLHDREGTPSNLVADTSIRLDHHIR